MRMTAGSDTPDRWLEELNQRRQAIQDAVQAVGDAAAALTTTTADAAARIEATRLEYFRAIAVARGLIGTRSETRRALGITPHTLRTALAGVHVDD